MNEGIMEIVKMEVSEGAWGISCTEFRGGFAENHGGVYQDWQFYVGGRDTEGRN